MLRTHENMLSGIVSEYGPADTVKGLVYVLQTWADHYSDEGLKEKAIEYIEMAEKLEKVIGE